MVELPEEEVAAEITRAYQIGDSKIIYDYYAYAVFLKNRKSGVCRGYPDVKPIKTYRLSFLIYLHGFGSFSPAEELAPL